MGEETGRKSALRHVKAIVLLAVILAVSLAPAIAIRFFPRETSGHILETLWSAIGSRIGFSRGDLTAIWIMVSFVLAIVAGSALLLVLARELSRSVREGS